MRARGSRSASDWRVRTVLVTVVLTCVWPVRTGAQSARGLEVGAHVLAARSGEFDATSIGLSGRVAWYPTTLIGVEAEIGAYPGDFPDSRPFSAGQVEGLFGMTVGRRFDAVRLFAKARTGFLAFREASKPIVCIAIFPPPLSCTLALGRTLPALDLGGGAQIATTARTFLRVDAGDRLLKYPGPVFRNGRSVANGFWRHDLRVSAGAGLRF